MGKKTRHFWAFDTMYSQHCFFFSRFCCTFVYIIFQYIVQILCGTEPDDFSLLDYLSFRLKERTLFIPLQLERCLLLGLVLLINTQSGAVSDEDPTMLAVRRLKSHVRTTVCTGTRFKKFFFWLLPSWVIELLSPPVLFKRNVACVVNCERLLPTFHSLPIWRFLFRPDRSLNIGIQLTKLSGQQRS